MTFKRIVIDGFLSYYEKTSIVLSQFTTIVLGQNNTGKSKLFDAFNWVLFNKVFVTEQEEWLKDEAEVAEIVLNKRRAQEAAAFGGPQSKTECSVELHLEDEDGMNVRANRKYIYKIVEANPVFLGAELIVVIIDPVDGTVQETLSGTEAEYKVAEYLPEKLSRYFLFQGETVSEVMSLHNKSHFTNAINELARLDLYNRATNTAHTVMRRYSRKLEKELERDERTKSQQQTLSNDIEHAEARIEQLRRVLEDADGEQSKLQSEVEQLRARLEQYEEVKTRLKEIDDKKEEYKKKKAMRDDYPVQKWRKEVTERWAFYRVRDQIAGFRQFYDKLNELGQVPAPISQRTLQKSLDDHTCALCERPLSAETVEFETVKAKVHSRDTDALGKSIQKIFSYFDSFESDIIQIPTQIADDLADKEKVERAVKKLNEEVQMLEQELTEVTDSDATHEDRQKLADLQRQLREKKKRLDECTGSITSSKAKIQENERTLQSKAEALRQLAASSGGSKTTTYHALAEQVHETMRDLEESIRATIFVDIETKADEYFQEMTKENRSLGGRIKLDKEASQVYTVDEEGSPIKNINQANRISIQLSFIAGILTVARNQLGVNFPFIADAPFSALGGDNKLPSINSLINAFDQSILILKDDASSSRSTASDPVRELIKESSYIGSAYELMLSKEERAADQYTKVSRLKGER